MDIEYPVPLAIENLASASNSVLRERLRAFSPGFVGTFLVKRRRDMSFEDFETHQLDTHARLALNLPSLLDYRLLLLPPRDAGPQAFDAIAQVTFESSAAYYTAMASSRGEQALADLPNMLEMSEVRILLSPARDVYGARIARG